MTKFKWQERAENGWKKTRNKIILIYKVKCRYIIYLKSFPIRMNKYK